jgi:predicted nucleotidyltransferase
MFVFSMVDASDPLRAVDLFVDEPIPFAGLYERAGTVDVAGIPVVVASIEDLISLKRVAGRPQDVADIEALEEIRRANGDGS